MRTVMVIVSLIILLQITAAFAQPIMDTYWRQGDTIPVLFVPSSISDASTAEVYSISSSSSLLETISFSQLGTTEIQYAEISPSSSIVDNIAVVIYSNGSTYAVQLKVVRRGEYYNERMYKYLKDILMFK